MLVTLRVQQVKDLIFGNQTIPLSHVNRTNTYVRKRVERQEP